MQPRFARRMSYVFLCVSPLLMLIVGGLRVLNVPSVQYLSAGILVTSILVAAWVVGVRVIGNDADERRRLALAGGLLVAVWASLTPIAVLGAPGQATVSENELRYLVLIIDSIAVGGGLVVLREGLSEAGERFYSTLGFAAIMLASPLYLLFAAIMLEGFRELAASGQSPAAFSALGDLCDILLFFGSALTYVAAAAFAASLGRTQWLGRGAARAYISVSALLLFCLISRGLEFPSPSVAFEHWYTVLGYVAGIPAVPWLIPCMLGFVLLRRAGDESLQTSAA